MTALETRLQAAIADTEPELRDRILHAFAAIRLALDARDASALQDAIDHKDVPAILRILGIDGDRWPELEASLRHVLDSTLAPLRSLCAELAWQDLGETDFNEADLAPADFDELLASARDEIIRDSIAGIMQAIAIVVGSGVLGAWHLLATIGMTARQALIFLAGSKTIENLDKALRRAKDNADRQAAIGRVLGNPKLPSFIAGPIKKHLERTKDGKRFDGRSPQAKIGERMRNFRMKSVARDLATKTKERTKVGVWKAGQAFGVVSQQARKHWVTQHDEKVRHNHSLVESMNPAGVPLDAPFAGPFPGIQGPPAEMNCRCYLRMVQPKRKAA